ncbi:MAG: hypothetical protein ACXVYM_03245 [Gaiellaceae bacterium]
MAVPPASSRTVPPAVGDGAPLPSRRQLFALAAVLAATTITGAVAIDGLRHPAPAGPIVVQIVQTTPAPAPAPVRAPREGGD